MCYRGRMGIIPSPSLGWAPLPFPSANPSLPLPFNRSILLREFSSGSLLTPPSAVLPHPGGCLTRVGEFKPSS